MNAPTKIKVETWSEFLTRRGISNDAYKALSHAQQVSLTEEWQGFKFETHIEINSLDPLDPFHAEDRVSDFDKMDIRRDQYDLDVDSSSDDYGR